jgi:hypothetical protein
MLAVLSVALKAPSCQCSVPFVAASCVCGGHGSGAGVDSGIVLIGRDADRLRESLGGDARAVVLTGSAGIGKFAIWQIRG